MGDSCTASRADETTSLLRRESIISDSDQEAFRATLRRASLASLPEYYPDLTQPLADEPAASTLTVWTIVPVSLLGAC